MLLLMWIEGPSKLKAATPPPRTRAVLDAMVLFTMDIDALPLSSTMMPPPDSAEFPLTVLLTSVTGVLTRPALSSWLKIPPPSPLAVLPDIVLLVTVRWPPTKLAMPAPSTPEFPATVL